MGRTRILAVLLSVLCLCTVPAFAATPQMEEKVETIYYEDGSYLQITTTVIRDAVRTSTRRVSRDYTYRSDNRVVVQYTLIGTFEYDGKTSSATNATATAGTYQSGWSLKSHHEDCSGSSVYGTATFSGPSGDKTLGGSITCDKNGNIT